MKIKECCKEIKEYMDGFNLDYYPRIDITTCEEHWFSLEDVKYCPFCSKKLKIRK